MGLRETIAKALGYRLGTPQPGFMDMVNMQVPPSWGYQTYLKAYGEVGWLFACVNVIANAVARQEWHLYEINKQGEREELITHPLIDLLNNLNPFQTRYQFFYLSTMYKKLVGESFWQINFNGRASPKTYKYIDSEGKAYKQVGQPAEMWLAPPAYMSVITSPTEYIDHYEYRRTGMDKPLPFSIDEIIHIMTPNPYNPYRGLSEAQALTIDVDSERYASRYQQKLFFNEAVPGFIVKYPAADMPPAEQRKELVQEWDERFKGFRKRGRTAFLWGGEPATVTLNNRDMDFATLRNFDRDIILGTYGVPKSVLGLTEASTFASAKAGNYSFAFYVIHPELCALREAMNKELCPFFGDNLYLDFENPIPEDETMTATNAANLFKSKIITRDEARAMVDLEPAEDGGDEYFADPVPSFGNFGNSNPADNSPLDNNVPDQSKDLKKKSEDPAKEEYWKAYVRRTESYEKLLIASLHTIFETTKNEVLDNIKAGGKNANFDKVKIRDSYTEQSTPVLTKCLEDAMKAGMELIPPKNPHKVLDPGSGPIPSVLNQFAVEWLKKRIGWAAEQIGESLAKDLNKSLLEGFTHGEGIPQMTKRVMMFFSDPSRAQRIARTESIAAASQGTLEGYRASGVVEKTEFYTAIDERVCPYCDNYHERRFSLGEEMPIPLHPN